MKKTMKTKFSVGQTVFVVDRAECVRNGRVVRIPLGTAVTVRAVSTYRAKGAAETRYDVAVDGVPVCWLDEDLLSSAVLDVAA